MGGLQEEQPGSPPEAEGSPRQRGAVFPYSVNDYVIIKVYLGREGKRKEEGWWWGDVEDGDGLFLAMDS